MDSNLTLPNSENIQTFITPKKKKYNQITDPVRQALVYEVFVRSRKVKDVCRDLQINVSSAKNVLAIFKKEGRIEKKKNRQRRSKQID